MAEISRQEAVRYLLGESSEAEREALERQFFEDEAAAEEVEAYEDELVDDYVAGRFAGAERLRFEQSYLARPEHAAKVEFARALQKRLAVPQEGKAAGGSPRFLPLAAAVLLAVAGAYFAYRFNEARRELSLLEEQQASLERRQAELSQKLTQAQNERARLEKELELTRKEAESYASQIAEAQRDVAGTVAFTLAGGLVRDAAAQKVLEIPASAKQVKLSMPLPADHYASYSAEIRTPEGKEMWKKESLAARRADSALVLDLVVPARLLASGDYIVSVSGVTATGRAQPTADFSFRARKS